MRSRVLLAIAALSLVAADLDAQRVGRVGRVGLVGRGQSPERPADKPKMAPGIHDSRFFLRSYDLSRFSFEEYPMLSYFTATGLIGEGIASNYVAFGDGAHVEYRPAPSLAITGDFTGSYIGGPVATMTSEIGLRAKPWTAPRFMPFVDARVALAHTTRYAGPGGGFPFVLVYQGISRDDAFSNGTGKGVAFGVGVDSRINERFSVITTLSHARFDMRGRSLSSAERFDYTTQATRLAVGLRYSHGRWYQAPR